MRNIKRMMKNMIINSRTLWKMKNRRIKMN